MSKIYKKQKWKHIIGKHQSCCKEQLQELKVCPGIRARGSGYREGGEPLFYKELSIVCYHPHYVDDKVKGFSIVDETEVDVFLRFPGFLYDPANVGNLISGSSSFSKPSLDIWKFLLCIMLKPSMHDFKHDLSSWFQIGKGVRQGCILSPCLFNLYAEYIMRNVGLE